MKKEDLEAKVREAYPLAKKEAQERIVDELLAVDSKLMKNVEEWVESKPLSDIWVRDKYCINAVMDLRLGHDFADSIFALNCYLLDPDKEFLIWNTWA